MAGSFEIESWTSKTMYCFSLLWVHRPVAKSHKGTQGELPRNVRHASRGFKSAVLRMDSRTKAQGLRSSMKTLVLRPASNDDAGFFACEWQYLSEGTDWSISSRLSRRFCILVAIAEINPQCRSVAILLSDENRLIDELPQTRNELSLYRQDFRKSSLTHPARFRMHDSPHRCQCTFALRTIILRHVHLVELA